MVGDGWLFQNVRHGFCIHIHVLGKNQEKDDSDPEHDESKPSICRSEETDHEQCRENPVNVDQVQVASQLVVVNVLSTLSNPEVGLRVNGVTYRDILSRLLTSMLVPEISTALASSLVT